MSMSCPTTQVQKELWALLRLHNEGLQYFEEGAKEVHERRRSVPITCHVNANANSNSNMNTPSDSHTLHHLNAARECFHSAFTATTHLLRQTRNRKILYHRGSPFVKTTTSNPLFSDQVTTRRNRCGDDDARIGNKVFTELDCDLNSTSESESESDSESNDDNSNSQRIKRTVTETATRRRASTATTSVSSRRRAPLPAHFSAQQLTPTPRVTDDVSSPSLEDLPLFSQPLHLPTNVTINQFVFINLYNLALTTHLTAMLDTSLSPTKRETLFKRASRQWDLVYPLQWKQGLNLRPIHGLAILLNLGHIKHMCQQSDRSQICYRNILSAIHILQTRQQDIPHRGFFLHNAFLRLDGGNRDIAASAA